MDKILISLEVPSIERSYEVYVPDFLPVRELTGLLVQAVQELSGGLYAPSGSEFLVSGTKDFLLSEEASLSEYDIGNGDRLLLM